MTDRQQNMLPEIVADISTNILLEVAKSGKVLFANGKAGCVFQSCGRSCRHLDDLVPSAEAAVLRQNVENALYQQYPHHFYWPFQNRYYLVYVYPTVVSAWLCLDDITEKRQMAHLLHINNQRVLFAERIAKLGYWELDIGRKRFYWSEEMYKIFGVTDGGKTFHKNLIREQIYPADMVIYKQKLKELFQLKKDVEGTLRIVQPSGKLKYCRFMAGIIYENGEPKIAGAFQDISDLAETRAELQKVQHSAEKDDLADVCLPAHICHDLRQPLQSMRLLTERLKIAPKGEYPEIIADLERAEKNMDMMLCRFADTSQAGFTKAEKDLFNLGELLRRICREYRESAANRNLKIKFRLNDVFVRQNAFGVERIIRNLLENALKYARQQITVGNSADSFWGVDDGTGIDKNKQKHIFKEFYQCNTLRQGSGLGLYIVEKLAAAGGMKIRLKSKCDHYTAFKINL